jgi:hypothetical protein
VAGVEIIVPWQDGCVYRRLNLDWVHHAWESVGFTVRLGTLEPDEPWCKARAVTHALAHSDAERIVIADADVWVGTLDAAVEALEHHPFAMPFGDVHRLDPNATSLALSTGDLSGPLIQRAYRGVLGGGILAIDRDRYDEVPLDARFVGWGQEDEAWGAALEARFGRGWRSSDPLYHLWHPPQARQNRAVGSEASRNLRMQYFKARRFPEQMEALLAEARRLSTVAV